MSSDKKQDHVITGKDVVTAVASAGAAATSAFVVNPASAPSVLALAAVLTAIFPPVLAAMTEAGARRMKARTERFFAKIVDEWGREKNKAPEEIARELEAAKEDPNIADTIWRTVRGLMEAPNDAAAVPLGVLAAEYIRAKHPTDAFFRGVVRLLEELEAAELEELRRLLGWVIATTKRAEVELIARAGTVDAALDEYVNDVGVDSEPEKRARTTVVSDPERFFALLTGSRLAVSLPGMRFDRGLPEVTVRRNIVERLLRILGTT